jgi:hypothetical protein
VAFAQRLDPAAVCRHGVRTLLRKLGWPVQLGVPVTEGVTAWGAMEHMYVAFEVAAREQYFPGTDALRPEVQAHHDRMRRKGWKVIVVPQAGWEALGVAPGAGQSVDGARGAWLMGLTAAQAPFEARRGVEMPSERDFDVYAAMKRASERHGSTFGIGGKVRGKGRVRMRTKRTRG